MNKIYLFILLISGFYTANLRAQTLACNAQFSINIQNGNTGIFTPTVLGDSINTQHGWYFGDGASASTAAPSHQYQNNGTYTVKHILKRYLNGAVVCNDSASATIVIQNACNLKASFNSYHDTLGLANNVYYFNNTSTGYSTADSIRWTFGDGGFSNQPNPTHTYATAGTYNVCLRIIKRTASGELTNCGSDVCHSISFVSINSCSLVGSFTSNHDSTGANINVFHFFNTSIGFNSTDSVRWNFGDGSFSNQVNPIHTYATPGTYNVCVRIIKRNSSGGLINCVAEVCHPITFTNATVCNLQAYFSYSHDSIGTNSNVYHFINQSVNLAATDSIRWTFGDGTFSNQPNPKHSYPNSGTYNVCLVIIKRNANGTLTNCVKEYCKLVTVSSFICTQAVVNYTYTSSTNVSNLLHFMAQANVPIGNQVWKISKIPQTSVSPIITINQNNPYYLFPDTGHYRVCLIATIAPNCVKEICKEIYIGSVTANPSCVATPFPNPTHDFINANVILNAPMPITMKIFSSSNGLVSTKTVPGIQGVNTVSDYVGNLPVGSYYLRLIYGNSECSGQFIKL